MLEIRTDKFKTRKKVLIDGDEYTVRRMGSGEELALSQAFRRLSVLAAKEDKKKSTSEDEEEAIRLGVKVMDVLTSCFDDGGDQKKSKKLVASLSPDEVMDIYDTIFKTAKPKVEPKA